MNTIYKYTLQIQAHQTVLIPGYINVGSILKLAWKDNSLCLWAMVDDKEPEKPVEILMYGTGMLIADDTIQNFQYFETIFQGPYVWHFFARWSE